MTAATIHALNTTWFYGTSAVRPKQTAIDHGTTQGHSVFLERVTNYGRQFGSYQNVEALTAAVGTDNMQLFEIITGACKMYFDVEYIGIPDELDSILVKISKGSSELLGVDVVASDIKISCATGVGESAAFKDKVKQSYHIIIDNGYAFATNKDVRGFVDMVFPDDTRVDKSPYGRSQSFKLIHNSKLGSIRVQIPIDGGTYHEHMVTAFKQQPIFYSTERLKTATAHTVRQQVIRPSPLLPAVQAFVEDAEDVFSVRTLLKFLPNGPPPLKQPFAVYMSVACICVNESEPFEVFSTWASQYPRYSQDKSLRIWNSLYKRTDGYDVHTLRKMVSECHPSLFKTMEAKYIHQCLHPTIDLQEHGIEYISYDEPLVEPWVQQSRAFKHLFIRSAMGSGKTHQLRESIRDLKPESVLIITPRQLFARSMLGTLKEVLPDLKVYKDVPHDLRSFHSHMICQVESLWSLHRRYDMVILDECESILHFEEISRAFEDIVINGKTCFWSDAFLSDRSIKVCEELDPSGAKVFIHNRWVSQGRKAYHVGSYQDAKVGLKKAAHHLKTESNVVVSASKELAKETAAILEKGGPTMLICSETDDDVKAKLEDVNTFLEPYQHFVYTSAITVGTSYDRRNHYNNIMLYTSACSNNVRDSMQASMRVRHISSGNLFYGTYPRYYGADRFNIMSRGRLEAIIEGREVHALAGRRQQPDMLYDLRQQLQPWQKSLWVFNTQENNVSAFLHGEMVRAYLLLCGYELVGEREHSVLEEVDAHVNAFDYHEIEDVSLEQQQELQKIIQRGAATTIDKIRWLKGNFKQNIVKDVSTIEQEIVCDMFQTYARKQLAIQTRLANKRSEQDPENMDQLLSIFQDNTAQKLEAIRGITDMMGIKGSWEVGAQIERAVMEKSCQKVLDMRKDLQTVFDLRLRETKRRDTLKRGLELLNSVLRRWGFTEVVTDGPRKRARIKGKREDMRGFAVAESEGYKGFGRFT